MKIVPVSDFVIVELFEEPKENEGIALPDRMNQPHPLTGTVIAAGPGRADPRDGVIIPMGVEVGDVVILPRGMGSEVKAEGKKAILVRETELLAVVVEEKKGGRHGKR